MLLSVYSIWVITVRRVEEIQDTQTENDVIFQTFLNKAKRREIKKRRCERRFELSESVLTPD